MSNPLSLVCLCCLYLFISTDIMICSKKMYPLTIFIWITWGNLLRSVPRVSVGHQHMNFFCHTRSPSWILSYAENLASSSLQERVMKWLYYVVGTTHPPTTSVGNQKLKLFISRLCGVPTPIVPPMNKVCAVSPPHVLPLNENPEEKIS